MQVANTRESLILALKNDKNSERWEEFVNQYYDFLKFSAEQVDKATGRSVFIPDGVDSDEVVEQTFWQLKNIIHLASFDGAFVHFGPETSRDEINARYRRDWETAIASGDSEAFSLLGESRFASPDDSVPIILRR